MRENLHRFFRAARGAGVRVSPAESIDAMRAVANVGFSDRGILRDTFLLTLAKTQDEKQALGECFDLFFDHPSAAAGRIRGRRERRRTRRHPPQRAAEAAGGQPTEGNRPAGADAAVAGPQREMAAAIANASNAASLSDIRYFTQRGIFSGRILDADGDRAAARRSRRSDRDQSGAGGTADGRTGSVARNRSRHGFAGAAALRPRGDRKSAQRDPAQRAAVADRAAAGRADALADPRRSRAGCASATASRANGSAAAISTCAGPSGATPPGAACRSSRRGSDGGATGRKSSRCATSRGSVARVSDFFLLLIHSLHEVVSDVRSFAFSGHLIEVSDILESKTPEEAMRRSCPRSASARPTTATRSPISKSNG